MSINPKSHLQTERALYKLKSLCYHIPSHAQYRTRVQAWTIVHNSVHILSGVNYRYRASICINKLRQHETKTLDIQRNICRKIHATFMGAGARIVAGGLRFLRLTHFFIDLKRVIE